MRFTFAEDVTRALGGEWHVDHGQAPCPVCQAERRPDQWALHIEEMFASVQLFCRNGCPIPLILRELRASSALSGMQELPYFFRGDDPDDPAAAVKELHRRNQLTAEIWREAQPIEGSPAEAQLHQMGLVTPDPGSCRYHPICWHPYGPPRPALVGALNQNVAGAHLWYLPLGGSAEGPPDLTEVHLGGSDKIVPVATAEPDEKAPRVIVGNLLSGLALASGLLPGMAKIWVAASPAFLPRVWLPEQEHYDEETGTVSWSAASPGRLLISREGATASRRAAELLANRARAHGWDVSFLTAPKGQTWMDVLKSRQVRDWGGLNWAPGPSDVVRQDPKESERETAFTLNMTGVQMASPSAPVRRNRSVQ